MSTTTSTLQTTYSWHQHNQRTEQNDLTLPTDRNWPITTDVRYLSLTANNIMAKLTNQVFTNQTYNIWLTNNTFTWLWWWLLLRLSKRQSLSPTTVLFRTTLTRTITLHNRLSLQGSNPLLYNNKICTNLCYTLAKPSEISMSPTETSSPFLFLQW